MNPFEALMTPLKPYTPPVPEPKAKLRTQYVATAESNPWGLTAAEMRVMDVLIVRGTNEKTAQALGRSLHTVQCTLVKVFRKMQVDDRVTAALAWQTFRREGMLTNRTATPESVVNKE